MESKFPFETEDSDVSARGFGLLARLLEEYAEEEKAVNSVITGNITQRFVSKVRCMMKRIHVEGNSEFGKLS